VFCLYLEAWGIKDIPNHRNGILSGKYKKLDELVDFLLSADWTKKDTSSTYTTYDSCCIN
jgi:hypothetical protein